MAKNNYQQKSKEEALKDYVTVNQRKLAFYKDYPNGIIEPDIYKWTDDGVICVVVKVYKTPEDYKNGIIAGKAFAYEKEGSSFINNGNALENCETSAIGRALGNMGYGIEKHNASREEVENALARQEAEENQPQAEKKQAPKRQNTKQKEAKPAQTGQPEGKPITGQTVGKIKLGWLTMGYTEQQLNDQLVKLYGRRLTRLTEEEGLEFYGMVKKKLKELREAEARAAGAKKAEPEKAEPEKAEIETGKTKEAGDAA